MAWTRELPKEDGIYWFRSNPSEKASVLGIKNGCVCLFGPGNPFPVQHLNGEWYGPIEQPE